jgi:hypothetical protein
MTKLVLYTHMPYVSDHARFQKYNPRIRLANKNLNLQVLVETLTLKAERDRRTVTFHQAWPRIRRITQAKRLEITFSTAWSARTKSPISLSDQRRILPGDEPDDDSDSGEEEKHKEARVILSQVRKPSRTN